MTEEEIFNGLIEGIEKGLITVDGTIHFKQDLIADSSMLPKPETQDQQPDRYGNLPPETAYNGSRNVVVEAKIREYLNGDNEHEKKAARMFPKYIVVLNEWFNPKRPSPEWYRVWANTQRQWAMTSNNNRITDYHDRRGNKIPDHAFVSGQNATWPDHEAYPAFMSKLGDYVDKWITDKAKVLRTGGLPI